MRLPHPIVVEIVPHGLDESVGVAVAVGVGRRLGHTVHVDPVGRHLALVQRVIVEDGLWKRRGGGGESY